MHVLSSKTFKAEHQISQHSVVGAIIIKLTYGYTIDTKKPDRLIEIAEKALGQFALAIVPGAWLVDTIPIRESKNFSWSNI